MVTNEEVSVVTPADWVPGPKQGSWNMMIMPLSQTMDTAMKL